MKAVNLILAVMFLVFASVQLNDPDPFVWILIYGSMAVVCIMAAFRYYNKILLVTLLVIYIAYSFVFMKGVGEWLSQDNKLAIFDDVAKMQYPFIEESREFLGLMICIIVLVIHLILSRKPAKVSLN